LERPHHLRAVRRRRWRDARPARARTAASSARICARMGATRPSSTSMAVRPRRKPLAIFAWKGARSSSTRWR
jgi:hypothetical protein